MLLRVKRLYIEAGGKPIVLLNKEDADDIGVRALGRVKIVNAEGREITSVVNVTYRAVEKGIVGAYDEVASKLKLEDGSIVDVRLSEPPRSIYFVREKLKGKKLTYPEIYEIVRDVVDGRLTEVEISAFVTALHTFGLDLDEATSLSKAMVEVGETLNLDDVFVVDKHSIGGVPGDKTSLVAVPTIAAAGLTIPKTSSRAITSASVAYDTPILIKSNGIVKIVEIGEFVDKLINDNERVNDVEVPVFDNEFKVSFKKLTGVFRHSAPKQLLEITLQTGRKVKVTKDHSVFVLKNGRILSLPTSELKKGDYVVVPRKINVPEISEVDLVREFLDKLPEKYLDRIFIKGLDKRGLQIKEVFNSWKNYMRYRRGLIPLSWLKTKEVRVPEGARLKFGRSKKEIPAIIKVSPELMKLLGFFAAEGHLYNDRITFYMGKGEKEIAEEIVDCIEKVFNLSAKISSPKPHEINVDVGGTILSLVFRHVFETGENAQNKKLSWIVLNCGPEKQYEFLRAYIRGNGGRRAKEHLFEISTISRELANGILYLTTILGVSCTYHLRPKKERKFKNYTSSCQESYRLYFTTKGLTSFINLIPTEESGLKSIAKNHKNFLDGKENDWKFSHILLDQKTVSFHTLQKNIKINGGGRTMKLLQNLANSEIGFLKIRDIKELQNDHPFVYDLCVDGYEKFVGGFGPIFLHNSGTADRAEVLMPVDLDLEEIKSVVKKTGGCLVWGGALHLSPADDIFVQVEYPLAIDPLLLPSIMSKKKAVNARVLVIDIPTGRGTKVKTIGEANALAKDFIELGRRLGIQTSCAITYGEQPIGYAIGPALEAREALETLMGSNKALDLINKAANIAGALFQMAGVGGFDTAIQLIKSGKSERKLREIIAAQGGDPDIKPEDIPVGDKTYCVKAENDGVVLWIDNGRLIEVARAAGAPKDKGAGVLLNKKIGDHVEKGDVLFTIYAESSVKLQTAVELVEERGFMGVGKSMDMLIQFIHEVPVYGRRFELER